jgi:Flp pilus assembly protein TadG
MAAGSTRGSAAIEFAFIAPVFFILLMGIMEGGVMYFSQFALQNAVVTMARQIRTGQAQSVNYATAGKCTGSSYSGAYASALDWYKDQICCSVGTLLQSCNTNLHISVQNYTAGFTAFGSTATGATASANDMNGVSHTVSLYANVADTYSPGSACDVVLVRATYGWTVATPLLSWFLINMTGNQHLLSATTAFRNEPFTAAVSGC